MATAKRSTKKVAAKKNPDIPGTWTLIGIQKDSGSAIHVACDSLEDCKNLCIEKNVNMDRPVYAKGPDGKMYTINQP